MHLIRGFLNKSVLLIISLIISILLINNSLILASDENIGFYNSIETSNLEILDRGLVVVPTPQGTFLSWRLFKSEATGFSSTGVTGMNFDVYRNGKKIANVKNSTNFIDKNASENSEFYVIPVSKNGEEMGEKSKTISPWKKFYCDLPLMKPPDGITPKGESYTYSANDMSVGDVDGDGEYEFFVKWDPSNSKDVSQKGYTGKVYIDCYELDGTLLYRFDLGVNIRAGAHYTQLIVYDFDGDGKAESMFKTAPGTKIIRYNKNGSVKSEKYITIPEKDREKYKNSDDYRVSAEDYYNHVVDMFMNWQNHEEVIAGNWPETLEECFGIEKKYDYPLTYEDADELASYFMDEYAPSRSSKNLLRDFEGFIIDGPEYLTVFNGETGKELQTINYKTPRYDDGLMWGDYAMPRIEPANRVDRFLAGVAYLDGKKPYAIFARGYYTRTTMVTYSWNGTYLKENWHIDSGWTPMTNPFNDSPHGVDGTDSEYRGLTTQGAHSISVADVDQDGKDEIIYGSSTIDNNGKVLYSSKDIMPEGSAFPGEIQRLGHGDSLHVADIDPDRDGLEIFMCHEGGTYAPYGYTLRDAKTGDVIFGEYSGKDTGRCLIGDIDPNERGLEVWAMNLRSSTGDLLSEEMPPTNANIKWAADMSTQIIEGDVIAGDPDVYETPVILDYQDGQRVEVLKAEGTYSNNYTKGNPCLIADIFGDWREELILRTTDSNAVRIYTNSELTNHKLYTLMHDKQYRTGIAWQNTTYNQPSYTSFYFATDISWENVPLRLSTSYPGCNQGLPDHLGSPLKKH